MSTSLSQIPTSDLLRLQSCVQNSQSARSAGSLAETILTASGVETGPSRLGLSESERITKAVCEASLHEFVKAFWNAAEPETPFVDGWHIQALCLHLEALHEGVYDSLLINEPPGTCKSLTCSVFFPAWCQAKRPGWKTLAAAYEQKIATRDSLKCRRVIRSKLFRKLWPRAGAINRDDDQKTRYGNEAGGWRIATSVGGAATGDHPDLLLVDDPIKAKDANSISALEAVTDWWDGTIASRGIIHGVRRLVIMQRLHVRDLCGHIINGPEGGDWVKIVLPMWAEEGRMERTPLGWLDPRAPGELLWPEGMPDDKADKMRRRMGSVNAEAQLQQRPVPRTGGLFKREWFEVIDDPATYFALA